EGVSRRVALGAAGPGLRRALRAGHPPERSPVPGHRRVHDAGRRLHPRPAGRGRHRKVITVNTVVVTGSASGMGQATARHFAERGWAVVGVDRAASPETTVVADVTDRAGLGAGLRA